MKTLPLALLAALAAFFVLPISFELAMSMLSVTGLATVLLADYTRKGSRLQLAPVVAIAPAPASRLRLAA